MKSFVIVVVAIVSALICLRFEQPHLWNNFLAALKAPEGTSADSTASATKDSLPSSASAAAPQPKPAFGPDYINPEHVRPVVQPGEVSITTAAPDTNAPSTNAPVVPSVPATNSAPVSNANAPGTPAGITGLTPTSLPSVITTLSGKTYTGCVLFRVNPDSISFTDSTGGTKVLFSDLDPRFGVTFGYDPVAAKKYEDDEANWQAAIDARRAAEAARVARDLALSLAQTNATASQQSSSGELSAADRASFRTRIEVLNADIEFMKRSTANEGPGGRGAYADRISADDREIATLQRQLDLP